MVRYSKLAFRQLVRLYNVDVCYTPMIYAKNFLESEKCRNSELSVCEGDSPLIVQFATDDPIVLAEAAEMVYACSNGVDLNCGCPKHDVRSKGFGSALLAKPELLADMVRQTRARISDSEFSVSLKIRINNDIEKTVDLCRKSSDDILATPGHPLKTVNDFKSRSASAAAESAGVTCLTVHGRTPSQKAEPIDVQAVRIIKESVSIPIIANGGITTRDEALFLAEQTGVEGIMAANGLLDNPALFAGYKYTPSHCVKHFNGLDWMLYHQHLQYMLRPVLSSQQRRIFNELNGRLAIDQYLSNLLND